MGDKTLGDATGPGGAGGVDGWVTDGMGAGGIRTLIGCGGAKVAGAAAAWDASSASANACRLRLSRLVFAAMRSWLRRTIDSDSVTVM
jgi:hypothetical protein